MILLDNVVEIFDTADFDLCVMLRIVAFDRRCVGAAPVDGDLLWCPMLTDRFAKEPQRRFEIALGRQ